MSFSSIQESFAWHRERVPDEVAVSCGTVRLTYRELDERANQIAHRLRDLGVGPGAPVAVLLERSANIPLAFLAAVKTGGFVLPLHSAYPLDRMRWILDQAGGPVLLTDEVMRGRGLPYASRVIDIDAPESATFPVSDLGVVGDPEQIAYLMYTSGSTGHPKGVAVTHGGLLDFVSDSCWDGDRHRRVLSVAPYAFGVAAYEVWMPMLRGYRTVVAPPGALDVERLRRLLDENEITAIHLTAGLFRVVADEAPEIFAGVAEVLTGGDTIAPAAVQRVLDKCPDTVVRTLYGATEVTAFVMTAEFKAPARMGPSVPIGRPMDGVRAYLLDTDFRSVPVGAEGELYIGGPRLSRGYFNDPGQTAERFVRHPPMPSSERMYRTGDLMRSTPDGVFTFIGRADDQVKIRGHRVELGEIESVLAGCPGVTHAVVVARSSVTGERRLAAYLVPEATDVDIAGVRDRAAKSLPEYMMPTAFAVIGSLPLTPNGKVDRARLPEIRMDSATVHRSPVTDRQRLLCRLFAEVLDADRVGLDDSFFDLDGQSLLAVRLINRIRAELGVELKIADLFNAPTVAELDATIEDRIERDDKAR